MSFNGFFLAATGNEPFPWQTALYEKFSTGQFPTSANIPTGLGKTSIVAVWLIALAVNPDKVPRRLVYVVNRRTVVDQTTAEVEKLRMALSGKPELKGIVERLYSLCALPLPTPDSLPLAVSTLRGQFADNREWSADPARPAVIVGTVDMIGSGLLFSRYTASFKLRPHHAAFLAQDVLLIHDEAHLEPAFQHLLDRIVLEQARSNDLRKLRVLELSATTRSEAVNKPFKITEDDKKNEIIRKRLCAVKTLSLVPFVATENDQVKKIIDLALGYKNTGRAILIFVRSVESAIKIAAELDKGELKGKVISLTGTMRGKERDGLATTNAAFQRFLPKSSRADDIVPVDGTVFLVATSAGEVGINISADDLICDLSTYESMAQRFGRVNRFGDRDDSRVTVVYPKEFPHTKKIKEAEKEVTGEKEDGEKKLKQIKEEAALELAIEKTLHLLQKLEENHNGDVSPSSLEKLPACERAAAFSPLPEIRIATDIQFDAWALTSIREHIAARPPVAPYLHGLAEWQPHETHVAWREEVDSIQGELLEAYPPEDLLEDFPLKPHELLRDTSKRIAETLSALIENYIRQTNSSGKWPSAWLLRESGTIKILPLIPSDTLFYAYQKGKGRNDAEKNAIKRHKQQLESEIAEATLILPESIGGISEQGFFCANSGNIGDVADIEGQRLRIRSGVPDIPVEYAGDYRLIRIIDTRLDDEDDDSESSVRYWLWLNAKTALDSERRAKQKPETLREHTKAVVVNAAAIAEKLLIEPVAGGLDLQQCILIAGEQHDPGKDRRPWQIGIGNSAYDPSNPETIFAKSGGDMRPRHLTENYRHEFGSITDASVSSNFIKLGAIERDIVLHLIAAHHGRARPHFPPEEVFDYNLSPDISDALAAEVPHRFARLQHHFGRWGLVWLESLLRAADYAASAGIVANNSDLLDLPPAISAGKEEIATVAQAAETLMELRVDVANPGQYFACCGLFELAARLAPEALAYFEQDGASKQWRFKITNTSNVTDDGAPLSLRGLFTEIGNAEITAIDPDDSAQTPLLIGEPFNLHLDWWHYEGGKIGKLKTWAGQMSVCSVAIDMQQTLQKELTQDDSNIKEILFKNSLKNSGQPYYFDANYAVNAQTQDVGFSVDKLKKGGVKLKTAIVPAVELLSLIGLQRARPLLSGNSNKKIMERLYDYYVWQQPVPIMLVSAAVAGILPECYQLLRFANPSRAKDYRAFMPAVFQ